MAGFGQMHKLMKDVMGQSGLKPHIRQESVHTMMKVAEEFTETILRTATNIAAEETQTNPPVVTPEHVVAAAHQLGFGDLLNWEQISELLDYMKNSLKGNSSTSTSTTNNNNTNNTKTTNGQPYINPFLLDDDTPSNSNNNNNNSNNKNRNNHGTTGNPSD